MDRTLNSFRGNNHADTRERNQRLVLRAILRRGPMSRPDLAALSGLAPATITYVVNQLLDDGLLIEVGSKRPKTTTRGPKQVVLDLNPEGAAVLAIVLGIYSRTVALVGPRGQILAEARNAHDVVDRSLELSLTRTEDVARELLAASRVPLDAVVGIGVAAEGHVDSSTGVRTYVPYRNWLDVPIATDLEARFGIPTVVANIAHALAVGEAWFGQGQHVESLLLVNIATTISAAAVVKHEVLQSHRDAAGAIDHVVVDPDGEPCVCGKVGCLATIASEHAIVRAAEATRSSGVSPILDAAVPDGETLSIQHVVNAAKLGDEWSILAIERSASAIGGVLAPIVALLQPESIVIAGNLATAADQLFRRPLMETLARDSVVGHSGLPSLVLHEQSAGLSIAGAAALALDRHFYLPQFTVSGKEA